MVHIPSACSPNVNLVIIIFREIGSGCESTDMIGFGLAAGSRQHVDCIYTCTGNCFPSKVILLSFSNTFISFPYNTSLLYLVFWFHENMTSSLIGPCRA